MKSSFTSATKVKRVLIADDHPVVREGLVTILKSEKDIKVPAHLTFLLQGRERGSAFERLVQVVRRPMERVKFNDVQATKDRGDSENTDRTREDGPGPEPHRPASRSSE